LGERGNGAVGTDRRREAAGQSGSVAAVPTVELRSRRLSVVGDREARARPAGNGGGGGCLSWCYSMEKRMRAGEMVE
jgi:hypothetical protein